MKYCYFIFGIMNWIIFALDIEHDKDFFTWIWLLTSLLFFAASYISYQESKQKKRK